MKIVILLGPPGSGKGTQAVRLAHRLGLTHLSTGDLLRNEIAEDTELGRLAASFMNQGALVPDSVAVGMIQRKLDRDGAGFVLDGFPRTVTQAEALEESLNQADLAVLAVLNLRVDTEEVVRRLSLRRSCPSCGAAYHLHAIPPKTEGVCDNCGKALFTRDDDQPDVIRTRLATYEEKTKPLEDYYSQKGLLVNIQGDGAVADVLDRMLAALEVTPK